MEKNKTITIVLVYFSVGNVRLHDRTLFSIISFLPYESELVQFKFVVYTDEAPYFSRIDLGDRLTTRTFTQENINQIIGSDGLIHKAKIFVIEEQLSELHEDLMVYVDSDTFCKKDPTGVFKRIGQQTSVMHLLEYPMSFLRTYDFADKDGFGRISRALLEGKIELHNQVISDDFNSWNAGIIGVVPGLFNFRDVYELTDELYEVSENHACEQYAFSYCIEQKSEIIACDSTINHYWHKIKKKIADDYIDHALIDFEHASLDLVKIKSSVKKLSNQLVRDTRWLTYEAMISFDRRHFGGGYWFAFRVLLSNPFQPKKFFKDVGYHTLRLLKLKP